MKPPVPAIKENHLSRWRFAREGGFCKCGRHAMHTVQMVNGIGVRLCGHHKCINAFWFNRQAA